MPKREICFCYEKNRSGETIVMEELAHELSEFQDLHIQCFAADTFTKTEVAYFWPWLRKNILFWFRTFRKCSQVRSVFVSTYVAGFMAVLFKPFFGFQICFIYQGSRLLPKTIQHIRRERIKHRILYCLTCSMHQFFLWFTDVIVVPALYSQRELESLFGGIHHKFVIIPNGVDVDKFSYQNKIKQNRLRKYFGIPMNTQVVLYAGRIHPDKGILPLVQAVRQIKNTTLIIARQKSTNLLENEYEKQIKEQMIHSHAKNVLFLEPQRHDMPTLLSMAAVVVLPSLVDHFPLIMLESLSCGTPFLGSTSGAMPDVLGKVDSGLVLKRITSKSIRPHILNILDMPHDKLMGLRDRCRRIALRYSRKNMASAIYTAFIN